MTKITGCDILFTGSETLTSERGERDLRAIDWVLLSTALTNLITAIIGLVKVFKESKKKKKVPKRRGQRKR
ncbi:hypothetical protein [Paenibacillus peoriae]|uniref:hypothetical protein n=1 Tax=Paenibacillus peoriae TaxID=59893 RepID=UPI0012D9A35F|nr:hypothetical protein [Paenibacillus peoriae]